MVLWQLTEVSLRQEEVLGFNYIQTMIYIILPQAFKNILPALANEFIVLLKETQLQVMLLSRNLTKGGDIIRSRTYSAFMPLITVAVIYLVMVMVLYLFSWKIRKETKK